MHIAHHPLFIALSSLTAWLGAWTALDVFRRVSAHVGAWRLAWLAATAVAMGLSIWSMHFIAMLGFNPGVEVRYDAGRTVLSLLLAIATTAFAFFFARGGGVRREIAGGVVMGAGICTMHYVGMSAVITSAVLANDPVYVVLAFIVAVTASTGALFVARSDTTALQRVLTAAVLAFAIVGMHYTAMYGVRIVAMHGTNIGSGGLDSMVLAVAVGTGTLFILLLALIAASSDRRFEAVAVREASRSEQQLRAILDNLPIGVFVAESPSGDVRFANREAARLLGEELSGQALWAREGEHGSVGGDGRRLPQSEHVLYRAMTEQRRVGPELRAYRRPDGSVLQIEVTAAPLPHASSTAAIAVTAFQDVTSKLQAEEQARQRIAAALNEKAEAEAALAHAQRLDALGRLTGGVAHDFNNLLTVIIGALDVILRHPDDAARRRHLGEAALAAGRRGQRLTAQLLAFARRQPLQFETRELNELIRECEPLLRRAVGHDLQLTMRLCENKGVSRIDPAHFEATLLNLIVNAIDASPAGGEIVVETEVRRLSANDGARLADGEYFRLSVIDGGHGMSVDVIKRIFEPFFTTKPAGKGTGLGLSQVYGFVKQSGGEVVVNSAVGQGSSFHVYLPISAARAEFAGTPDTAGAETKGPLAILLVEDDASVGAVTEMMLTDLGHKVHRAANADEALRVVGSDTELDVVLSDVVMPGEMNGVELAKQAATFRPGLRILLTSGYAGDSLDEALAQGAWPFLRKPFLSTELAAALAKLAPEPGDGSQLSGLTQNR
ncbi:MAG TPA: MHYT domain-containing protein [Steroidobacteraceae bacterium]|nr:MHYT domain-containing protein [Steroidobacteraceae bacterium]